MNNTLGALEIISKWKQYSAELAKLKQYEMHLRKQIAELGNLPEEGKSSKTTTISYAPFDLKIVRGYSHSINEKEIKAHYAELTDSEKAAINWKPVLVGSKIADLHPGLLRDLITTREAAPRLTLVDKQ